MHARWRKNMQLVNIRLSSFAVTKNSMIVAETLKQFPTLTKTRALYVAKIRY